MKPDVLQLHMAVPLRFVSNPGRCRAQLKQIGVAAACRLSLPSQDAAGSGAGPRRVAILGNYGQCAKAQELLQEAVRAEHTEAPAEVDVVLLVRAEAAGVVVGKQGFVLKQMRRQSGAKIQLLREEVEHQRPCVITGSLASVLLAERHILDLVRAVPVGGPNLPRRRLADAPVEGAIVSWRGKVGWIQPEAAIEHPRAAAHKGHLYVHVKDTVGGEPLVAGQRVRFHVYEDSSGLGAEECRAAGA